MPSDLFVSRSSSARPVVSEKSLDGARVPALNPTGRAPAGRAIYVNGIQTPIATQLKEMQAIADRSGMAVSGIHNATGGFVQDLTQSMADKLGRIGTYWADKFERLGGAKPIASVPTNLSRNKAVDALAADVCAALKAGEPLHLVGHSQGALIVANALVAVQRRLQSEGMTAAQAEGAMAGIEVETFGGAVHCFPDGPQYVHYVNRADMVPGMMGVGLMACPGRGAQVHCFNDAADRTPFTFDRHMVATYLRHRVPFAQARAGEFH